MSLPPHSHALFGNSIHASSTTVLGIGEVLNEIRGIQSGVLSAYFLSTT